MKPTGNHSFLFLAIMVLFAGLSVAGCNSSNSSNTGTPTTSPVTTVTPTPTPTGSSEVTPSPTSTSTPTPTPTPTPTSVTLLSDGFESTLNSLWQTYNPPGIPNSAIGEIVTNPYSTGNSSAHVYQMTGGSKGQAYLYCESKAATWTNYSLEAKVYLSSVSSGAAFNMAVYSGSGASVGYGLMLWGGGSVYLYKNVNGDKVYTPLGINTITYLNKWTTFKLIVSSSAGTTTLRLYINGEPHTTPLTDSSSPYTVGGIAFQTYDGASVCVDDVKVQQ